jgi:2-methylisocitrate lyase-like PEP mutase family enzyme
MSDPEPGATFRALHESGCFTMPNAWDAGSARLLASHMARYGAGQGQGPA